MKDSQRRPIEDFAKVLHAIGRRRGASTALVGGQAVNAWATVYLDSLGASLERHLPLTSRDIDVAGSPDLLMALHRELGGELRIAGPRQVVFGTLTVGEGAQRIELDVLRVVGGVGSIRATDTVPIELCSAVVPVLFPHLLLRGKLSSALQLEQRGRQDVKHVEILVLVLGEFLRSLVLEVRPANERAVLKLLQEVLEILSSSDAQRFAKAHRFSFRGVMPARELASASARLQGFAKGELARARIP